MSSRNQDNHRNHRQDDEGYGSNDQYQQGDARQGRRQESPPQGGFSQGYGGRSGQHQQRDYGSGASFEGDYAGLRYGRGAGGSDSRASRGEYGNEGSHDRNLDSFGSSGGGNYGYDQNRFIQNPQGPRDWQDDQRYQGYGGQPAARQDWGDTSTFQDNNWDRNPPSGQWRSQTGTDRSHADSFSSTGYGGYGGGFAGYRRGDQTGQYGQAEQYGPARQGSHSTRHDPDYHQWRSEQLRDLDNDYDDWRKERYTKFSDEFNNWRSNRSSQGNRSGSQQGGSSGANSGSNATDASSRNQTSESFSSGTQANGGSTTSSSVKQHK